MCCLTWEQMEKEVATSLFHHAGHILSEQLKVLITVASLEKGDRKNTSVCNKTT